MKNVFLLLTVICISSCKINSSVKFLGKVNQVLYLSNNKVYCYNLIKQTANRLTFNNDTIEDYSLSPTKRFIAYERVIKYVDSPGIYEEEPQPKEPLCSIVIFDLSENKKVCEVFPKKNEFIRIDKWTDKNKLLYLSADDFAVNGWLILNTNGETQDLGYGESSEVFRSVVFSKDVSTKLYVDNSNVLHKLDINTMDDSPIFKSVNKLYDYNISSNKKYIVWFEIINNNLGTRDKISLFSSTDMKQTEIYNEKAQSKNNKCISFSPNDSIISIELGRSITLLNIFSKEKYNIDGYDVCWIDSDNFIYCNKPDIYLYNIKDKSSSLLIKNANKIEYYK